MFEKIVNRVIDVNEKGYANRKSDLGGETMWGITKDTARRAGYNGSMRNLSKNQAIDIYKKEYWNKSKIDYVKDVRLAFLIFDANVNHGISNSIKMLQRAINKTQGKNILVVDGIIGNKTLAEIYSILNVGDNNVLILNLISERLKFFTSIKKTWEANGKGWINRVANNIDFIVYNRE